jgi:nicotinate-nucleotide adenylyltransferase
MKRKVGLFGGNFDPFHYGHLNSMVSVAEFFELDEIRAIPACMSPLRAQTHGSAVEQRVEMVRLGIAGHEDLIKIDLCEVERGGLSYTIDTVRGFEPKGDQLFLIVGMDQFMKFDQWREFDQILNKTDLVVTSRPGIELPYTLEDWPVALRALVADHDQHQAVLKSGRSVYFFQLADVESSGTEIRRKVRLRQSIHGLVPRGVEEYIREYKLYESVQKNIGDFEKFTAYCAGVLLEKGGVNVQTYDLRDRQAATEFTLIASGTSTRHTTALADHVIKEVKKEFGVWPENVEGQGEGRWVVVDYGSLMVHVFYDYVRQEYRLEDLWSRPSRSK